MNKSIKKSHELKIKHLTPGVTKAQSGLLLNGFITAERLVLRNWKNTKPPELTV